MKYILLKGASYSGKSTTMKAICKELHPTRVQRLKPSNRTLTDCEIDVDVANGSFIVEVSNKIILVAAGSPTEQGFTISLLIEIVIELKGRIDIVIVSMRKYEQKEGYDTPNELGNLGECILKINITRLPEGFETSEVWNARIQEIINVLQNEGVTEQVEV